MHTHTFLLLQRSFSPRRGNTITGRTERNSLDEQETTGTCRSSVARPVHRRCVSRRKTIKQVWNSVRVLPRLVYILCLQVCGTRYGQTIVLGCDSRAECCSGPIPDQHRAAFLQRPWSGIPWGWSCRPSGVQPATFLQTCCAVYRQRSEETWSVSRFDSRINNIYIF